MIKNIFTLVLVLFFGYDFACTATTSAVPAENVEPFYRNDYKYVPSLKAFFKIANKKKSWFDAKATCVAEGGDLAVFWTKEEADAVNVLLESLPQNNRNVWIGLQDLISQGEFETTNGVPISEVFVNWGEGEPNNAGGREHCVVFASNGKYNDNDCTALLPYVCRKNADTITVNKKCDNFDQAYKRTSLPNHCIKFHSDPKTFGEAYLICKAELAHLAIINSKEEARIYSREWAQYPVESQKGNFGKNDLFLGYHDLFQQNEFLTIFGKTLAEAGYDQWAPGQPDGRAGVEHCGGMFRDGTLNDVDCNIKAVFICEKTLDDVSDVSLHQRFQQ